MLNLPSTDREWFVWTALQYLGQWYKWGGDGPDGFDCSGLVIECGKSCGLFPRDYDNTAAGIYAAFKREGSATDNIPIGAPGSMVFYSSSRKPSDIYHVEICLDSELYIGASGGNRTTTTLNRAIHQGAFIKVRPIRDVQHRFYADPFQGPA